MLEAMRREIASIREEIPGEKRLDSPNSENEGDAEASMETDADAAHEPANPVNEEREED